MSKRHLKDIFARNV